MCSSAFSKSVAGRGGTSNYQWAEVVTDPAIKQASTEGGVRAAASSAVSLVIVTPGNPDHHDLEVLDEGRLVERLLLAASAHGLGANIGTLKGERPGQSKPRSAFQRNAAPGAW